MALAVRKSVSNAVSAMPSVYWAERNSPLRLTVAVPPYISALIRRVPSGKLFISAASSGPAISCSTAAASPCPAQYRVTGTFRLAALLAKYSVIGSIPSAEALTSPSSAFSINGVMASLSFVPQGSLVTFSPLRVIVTASIVGNSARLFTMLVTIARSLASSANALSELMSIVATPSRILNVYSTPSGMVAFSPRERASARFSAVSTKLPIAARPMPSSHGISFITGTMNPSSSL